MRLPYDDKRIRSTPATRRRDANVRTLIAALRNGPMLCAAIGQALNLRGSGTNKYIALLRSAGVLELERFVNPTKTSRGQPVYRLVADAGRVDDYLRSIDAGAAQRDKPKAPPRMIHRLQDDGDCTGRLPRFRIPAPDPVLAALFGMNQAGGLAA